jgi:hypothetical protein
MATEPVKDFVHMDMNRNPTGTIALSAWPRMICVNTSKALRCIAASSQLQAAEFSKT